MDDGATRLGAAQRAAAWPATGSVKLGLLAWRVSGCRVDPSFRRPNARLTGRGMLTSATREWMLRSIMKNMRVNLICLNDEESIILIQFCWMLDVACLSVSAQLFFREVVLVSSQYRNYPLIDAYG